MQSRRTLAKVGFAGLIALGGTRTPAVSAQTPETPTMDTIELTYQAMMATSNLPDLPMAPDGECAVVLQASGWDSSAAAVIHNASGETVYLGAVTATGVNESQETEASVPEENLFTPHVLKPGDYGVATFAFPQTRQEYTDVSVELELVTESEVDPAIVSMPVKQVQLVNPRSFNSMNLSTQNRSQDWLAAGSEFVGVFFTPEGEIADWFTSQILSDLEPGEQTSTSHGSSSIELTDSFMIGFNGRVLE